MSKNNEKSKRMKLMVSAFNWSHNGDLNRASCNGSQDAKKWLEGEQELQVTSPLSGVVTAMAPVDDVHIGVTPELHTDEDTDSPLENRYRQKMAKYAQVAQDNGYIFIPAIFSHTGQIHKEVMDLMFKQIKGKLELDDEQVQNSKIMGMRNLWVKQISCVINRTASRNIMAGRAALVEAVNASSKDDRTSTQRDDQLAANSTAAHNFIEDLDLLLINQDHRQH
mgnify:CR=1 FL=1